MKNKICLILVFLFSFLSGSINSYGKQDMGINKLESRINEVSEFSESGVMVRYETNDSKEKELNSIKENISKRYLNDCNSSENEVGIRTSTYNIQAYTWNDNDKTFVELKIINYSKQNSLSNLMKELTELQTKNIFDIRYFQYIKGKVNNIDETLDNVKNIQEITNINTLAIHNGYVGTANIYNGERVNFAVSTYDTGSYLIIGTPVIFATY
ncbi:hypothetical protein NNC19_21840 [Clostridium sp. SHJSY1]|uniref:hypothetical protein n=1 Tax=Clostridium sp. SHJSY1 TaxID=2942483 RepID=UPI0028764D3D|nr:hypothetical protein [Clostridium sp. SHJSY1]MDS0528333.1 hypothetical protein [Clostridium sp. SHJSY1]